MTTLMKMLGLLGLITIIQVPLYAHEGHGTPGAKVEPHTEGNQIKEATHEGAHNHGPDTDELYFEVNYKNKKLSVYPRVMKAGQTDNKVKPLALSELSSGIELAITYNRPKNARENSTPESGADVVEVVLNPPKGATRIEVTASAVHQNEKKSAKFTDVKLRN